MIRLIKNKKGFTLIEVLIVIGVLAILATVAFVGVDPARRFADTRNTQRKADMRSIIDAVNLYTVDNKAFPPGIDGSLKMIGTATTSCNLDCGKKVTKNIEYFDLDNFDLSAKYASAGGSSGWVLPTGNQLPGAQWGTPALSYDNNLGTYAQNAYGGTGWGQFIVFTLTAPIISDRVRVNADYLNADINQVDVDVFKDGAWVDVFLGGSEATWNCKYVELTFPKGSVTQARFRFNYKRGGFYYWLYEFQFYKSAPTIISPTVVTNDPTSIQESSAILHGTVTSDGGEPSQYKFDYGTSISYVYSTDWKGQLMTDDSFGESIDGLDGETTYHYRAQVKNSAGITNGPDKTLKTQKILSGSVAPTGHDDPNNTWDDETNAYDDSFSSYARSYHNIGTPQWSNYLVLDHPIMTADSVRFYARAGAQVNQVDIDVYRDGVWTDVYQGAFNDKQWVTKPFVQGKVTQARIRFFATNASEGFFWELYEFEYVKVSTPEDVVAQSTSNSSCLNLNPALVTKYIGKIPFDPSKGSPQRTYYAIQRVANKKIVIVSCSPELDESITAERIY